MKKRKQRANSGASIETSDITEMVFKRSQVDDALAALAYRDPSSLQPEELRAFNRRITRLLELDRVWGKEDERRLKQFKMAFHDEVPAGKGVDIQYSPFHVFMIAIALEMLNAGYKQKEVTEALALLRNKLEFAFNRSIHSLATDGELTLATNEIRDLPRMVSPRGGRETLDPFAFLIARSVQVTADIARKTKGGLKTGDNVILPKVEFGWHSLAKYLQSEMPKKSRSLFLIELAELAAKIIELLPKQERRERGHQ